MTRWLAHAVFALVAVAIFGITAYVLALLNRPPPPLEQKVELADRVLYYRLLDDSDVVFQLSGGERVVKLVTHLILEGNRGFDPRDRFPYGVRCELTDSRGKPLWSADVWTSSRQSKSQFVEGVWMKENAFSLEPGIEIADDRNLLVALPDYVPVGARLRLSKLGDVREVVARAYRRDTRTGVERQSALRSLAPGERDELIARTTYSPWDLVPVWERLERLRYRFERLAAVGDSGTDFLTRPVWFTGFRTPVRDLHGGVDDSAPIQNTREAEIEERSAFVSGPWPADKPVTETLSYTVEETSSANSRALRFIVRNVGVTGGGGATTAKVRFVDGAGKPLAEDAFQVPAPTARDPRTQRAGLFDEDGRWWPLGEEVDVRIVAPKGAARAELSCAGGPLAVRAFAYLPPPPEANNARFWFSVLPDGTDDLISEGRQVRLAYRPDEDERVATAAARPVYQALNPWPTFGMRLLFEPVAGDDRADVVARWPSGTWTSVKNTLVRFAEANRSVPEIRYSIAEADANAEIVVRIDGMEVTRAPLRAPNGVVRLPPVADGRRTVAVSSTAKSLRAYIDRPPAGPGAEVWRARTVYPLAKGPLRVQFRGAITERMSAHVYVPADMEDAPRVRFVLDGGDPARVEGRVLARYTVADRVVPVPPSDRPEAVFFSEGGAAGRGSLVSIPIGDDLVSGPHVLELRNLSDRRVWVSLFATDYVGER